LRVHSTMRICGRAGDPNWCYLVCWYLVAVKQRVTTEGGIVNRSFAGYFFRALTTS
jgi:hypothetical protein